MAVQAILPGLQYPRGMGLKEWCHELKPLQLYIMLTLTSVFFAAELVISHLTHSLTLLMNSYHMLCNIIALVGCLITIKNLNLESDKKRKSEEAKPEVGQNGAPTQTSETKPASACENTESSLRNTFGWARIDVLVMMIGCVFLFSLCFSLLIEAVQTLVHIDHNHEMHYPVVVLVLAGIGILLNGFCYLLIGGYTFHQGSYFHVTPSGDVVLDRCVTASSLQQGQRRLSSQTKKSGIDTTASQQPTPPPTRQGMREMFRDVIGCIYVIICAVFVYLMAGNAYARFVDPVISIFSAISLLILSYPYMKESGLILLQIIPNDINIDLLRKELMEEFPDVLNVHDLHVWQFTSDKVVATSHLVFLNQQAYLRISKKLAEFFTCKGITQATTQAEFLPPGVTSCSPQQPCLTPCLTQECRLRNCCLEDDVFLEQVHVDDQSVKLVHRKNGEVREVTKS